MLAHALQLILLAALMATAGFLWRGATGTGLALPWAGLLPGIHAAVLALLFVFCARVNRSDPAPRATWRQLLVAWVHELATSLRVFAWRQAFRSSAWPDQWVPAVPGQPGVIFLHGFVCNRGLWLTWLESLQAEGRAFAALNLEPVFGSIDDYAGQIDDAVRRMTETTGMPPVLICHSMGGLAARAWLRAANADARVRHVCTLGTPHHGTWLGRFATVSNGIQMRHRGEWLRQLETEEPPGRSALFTCWYSHCDNIVFPASAATLPGADNRFVAGVAHLHLVFDPQVRRDVLERLRLL